MSVKKFDFPLFLDTLFYAVAVCFLSLGVLRYYRVPLALSAVVAVLLGLAAGAFCFFAEYLLHRRKAVSKKEISERDALMLHLTLEKHERVRALLLDALLADGKTASVNGDTLLCDGQRAIPLFCMEPVSADAVAGLLREYGSEPFTIYCNSLTTEAEKLLLSFGKNAVRADEVYTLLRRTDRYPEKPICSQIPRRTVKTRLRVTFSKKNARPFFVSGLFLLIMSLFVIFPVYYLISGAVLMITAVLVRAVGYA